MSTVIAILAQLASPSIQDTIMEINGKIVELLPEQSGQSANGTWRKQQYILETDDQYPKKICFMVWSDKIDELAIKQGENLVVSVDIESREYNGRWYTDVKAWRVTRASASPDNIPFAEPEDFNNTHIEEPPLLDDDIPF